MTRPPEAKDKPAKVTGIAHLAAATRYSLAGFKRLMQETAFRHELAVAAAALIVLALAGAPAGALVTLAILALATLAVEALNSAIEEVVDLVSPEWSLPAKHAKDMGSFAVMAMLFACGLFFLYALASALTA